MNETSTEEETLITPSTTDNPLYEPIAEACRNVYDPVIPVNIFDLGLIYTVDIDAEGKVGIVMTLTAPGCPVAGELPGWVADAVEAVPGVREVYSVTGDWDIVAILKLTQYEDLDDVVTGHLRQLPGILRTQTMLAFRTYNEQLLDQGFGVGLDETQRR